MNDRLRHPEAGQALILVLLAMVGLLVVAGLAIDGGTVYLERRRMQNASDAAAREGARHLYLWQTKVAYPDTDGERILLEAVCRVAERSGVADTDGIAGNAVNDNVTAYYVDSIGDRVSSSDRTLDVDNPAFYQDCFENRCRPDGLGRCCGVEVEVDTEFGTSLIRLAGPVTAPVEAASAGVFIVADAYGGVGDSAAYALGSGCGNDQLLMPGDGPDIIGTAHSNDGVLISGSDTPTVDHLEYVNTGSDIGEEVVVDSLEILSEAVYPNLPFNLEFYRAYTQQNGTHHAGDWSISSSQSGAHWIDGNVQITSPDVTLTGVYFVEGDFEALGDNFALQHATIVTTGYIYIRSNDAPISPWVDDPWGLSLYSARDYPTCACPAANDSTSREFGIRVSGDHGTTPGVFYAPKSRICISADENDIAGGGIFADSIDVHGDYWVMLPWRPDGGGVGGLERITLVW